jgi:hypothetical protein
MSWSGPVTFQLHLNPSKIICPFPQSWKIPNQVTHSELGSTETSVAQILDLTESLQLFLWLTDCYRKRLAFQTDEDLKTTRIAEAKFNYLLTIKYLIILYHRRLLQKLPKFKPTRIVEAIVFIFQLSASHSIPGDQDFNTW